MIWLFAAGGIVWTAAMLWEGRRELDPNLIIAILLLSPIGIGLLPMWYGIKYTVRNHHGKTSQK